MFKSDKLRQRFEGIICVLVAIICIASLVVHSFDTDINSDQVEGVFWAQETLESGKILSKDFYYSYFMPFGANFFMLPFVKLFGMSLLANELGMLLFLSVIVMVAYYFSLAIFERWTHALLGTGIVLLAFCSQMGANLLHHILYYQLGFVCLLGMAASILRIHSGKAKNIDFILLGVFAFFGSANGLVTFSLANLPIVVAGIFSVFSSRNANGALIVKISKIMAILTFCGFAVYFFVTRDSIVTDYVSAAGSFSFQSIPQWFENLRKLPEDWMNLFFLTLPNGQSIISKEGIEILLELFVAIVAGFAPLLYICRFKKLSFEEKFIFIVAIAIWGVCCAQYIFFRGEEVRLLYSGLMINFTLLAVSSKEIIVCDRGIIVKVGAGLFLSVYAITFATGIHFVADTSLVDQLKSHELKYGFATYWNAMNNTVKSGEEVVIRQVDIWDGGIIKPKPLFSKNSWYEQRDCDFFVALSDDEKNAIYNKAIFDLAKNSFDANEYTILVYDSSNWNNVVKGKLFDFDFERMPADFWAIACGSRNGSRLVYDGGISYGPYMKVEAGEEYLVTICGENLLYADCQAYGSPQGVYFQKELIESTNEKIVFFVKIDQSALLEVGLSNPAGDSAEEVIIEGLTICLNR